MGKRHCFARRLKMIETYEVKNASGDVIEQVYYDTETLLIEEIRAWSETAQEFWPIHLHRLQRECVNAFEALEAKIVLHEANRLLDVADAVNEFRYFDLTGER
jgi:hypothetical protein